RYAGEEASNRTKVALRDSLRVAMVPLEHMPETNLAGHARAHVRQSFGRPFESLRYSLNTPRDLLLRGQYAEATTALNSFKNLVDNARSRMEQDKTLRREFETWADEFQALSARVIRAEREDPASLPTYSRQLDLFRSQQRNQDIERAFVLGNAARPLAAEVTFLTATAVHERAERAQLEGGGQAVDLWRNAAQWWKRFLDASDQARSPFPAREPHAKALLARCEQFTAK
ncbi:MAG TPA: hypothetical protein VKD90_29570, partial [Gemmataceae bacterium]|nr:hypothetical protein [Gemmataceae bacterium]